MSRGLLNSPIHLVQCPTCTDRVNRGAEPKLAAMSGMTVVIQDSSRWGTNGSLVPSWSRLPGKNVMEASSDDVLSTRQIAVDVIVPDDK